MQWKVNRAENRRNVNYKEALAPSQPDPPTVDKITHNSVHLSWTSPNGNSQPLCGLKYNLQESVKMNEFRSVYM